MKRAAFLAALLPALLAAGCTVGPNYRPPEPPKGLSPQFGEAVTGTQPAPDLTGWWKAYDDPELNRLIDLALAGNPDIGIATARIAQARAAEREAGARLLPEVDATAGANYTRFSKNAGLSSLSSLFGGGGGAGSGSGGASGGSQSGSSGGGIAPPGDSIHTYSFGFDASWEVDLFAGGRRGVESAVARREASVWNARDAQLSLVAEVADAYLQLRALQQRETIARDEVARQQNYLAIAEHTAQAGLIAHSDFIRQRTELAGAVAAIEPIVAQGKAEMHALGALAGQTPDSLIVELSQPRPELALPPVIPPGLPSELLRRRPDVRAAERNLAASTADIGVAVADLFPKLSLTGVAQFISTALSNLISPDSLQITANANATFPVLDFGRRGAKVSESKAAADEAYFQYQKTVLNALREVEDALIRIRADDEQRRSLAAGLADAQVAVRSVESRYRAGLTDYGDVLLARRAVLSAEDGLAVAEGTQRRDLVSLYKALGGGWEGLALNETEARAASANYTRPKD
jgi:NodT family efflux transporter outer membrane factor (OMF) lipoprotein